MRFQLLVCVAPACLERTRQADKIAMPAFHGNDIKTGIALIGLDKNPGVVVMKLFHSLVFSTALVLCSSSILLAASQEPIDQSAVQLQPRQQNGVTYLSGGIGLDESRAIQLAKGYNLHLTFSAGSANEYTPDVDLMIQSIQGSPVLDLKQVGPIVYVKLPAGKYSVVATRNGQQERSSVTLEEGAIRDVNAHWKDMN